MKKFLMLICIIGTVACGKSGDSHPAAAASGPTSTRTTNPDGSTTDTCSPQVVNDFEAAQGPCQDVQSFDQMGPCQNAQQEFAAKYPNIKCSYSDGGTTLNICVSTNNPALDCGNGS